MCKDFPWVAPLILIKREEVDSEGWVNLAKAAQLRGVTEQPYVQEPACDPGFIPHPGL